MSNYGHFGNGGGYGQQHQYQGGGIVHRYRDIPHLYELAQEMGFNV